METLRRPQPSNGSHTVNPVAPEPPAPPQIRRRLQFHRLQKIGLPLIALVPLLALFGVFGTNQRTTAAKGAVLEMEVRYPTRFRYKTIHPLAIELRNTSAQPLPSVTVRIDRQYVDAFSGVEFTPSAESITGEAYVIELAELPPGETHLVTTRLQAEKYWLHHGWVNAEGGGERIQVGLSTFTFP